jgi:hypothetical protein
MGFDCVTLDRKLEHLHKDIKIVFIIVAFVSLFLLFFFVFGYHNIESPKMLHSAYVIQNLRGDTIDTYVAWNVPPASTLHIQIQNDAGTQKIAAALDAIFSEETIEIDDSVLHKGPAGTVSTYYLGWVGALKKAAQQTTKLNIPTRFDVVEGGGNIVIVLSDLKNADGYAGFTKTITDKNQILKATITIYDTDELSEEQIRTIVRHEFGHALGLAHSTAPEDLMAPTIQTAYPYISDCDIDALRALYDGKQLNQTVCEK